MWKPSSSRGGSSRLAGSIGKAKNKSSNNTIFSKHDIFAFNPTYEWTSYKTNVGTTLSYLTILFVTFYIGITTRDYIVRPPELVSQGDIDLMSIPPERDIVFDLPRVGLRLAYSNKSMIDDDDGTDQATTIEDTDRIEAMENENPYVRFAVRHVVYRNQKRVHVTDLPLRDCVVSNIRSVCPDIVDRSTSDSGQESSFKLQGTFFKQDYQFLEITVIKCVNPDPSNNTTTTTSKNNTSSNSSGSSSSVSTTCAPADEINTKLHNGTLRIRVQVSIQAQQFDIERFHATGTGLTISNRSFEFFALPDLEVQSDLVMKARVIAKEQRFIGSPPLPEAETSALSFDRREITYRPRERRGERLMSFAVRLDDNVALEEVSYWCPSILDLFGLWGAMAAFAATLSLGFVATQYNRWQFYRQFHHVTNEKKREARLQTLATMEWIRNENTKQNGRAKYKHSVARDSIYSNLQAQYDALMVEPDIRLFESHHFDLDGRVAMSAAELKHPTTAFGELRRIALVEHGKKKRAAEFLSLWYARLLAKRGFLRDQERLNQIFSYRDESEWGSRRDIKSRRSTHNNKCQNIRRRRKPQPSKDNLNSNETEAMSSAIGSPDVTPTVVDVELGPDSTSQQNKDARDHFEQLHTSSDSHDVGSAKPENSSLLSIINPFRQSTNKK